MKAAEKLLRETKFSRRYQGYEYLVICVERVVEEDRRLCALIKEVYQPVADKYHVTYKAVERDIRTARDKAWGSGGKEVIERISGGEFYEPPTVGELIEILAEYLKKNT
ncbi:MAG TPA: hypothetical protein DCZ20_04470 [Lachnospiraceae bacterium]|nr:hypothetical protein [Lachnospiraceae bacterium]